MTKRSANHTTKVFCEETMLQLMLKAGLGLLFLGLRVETSVLKYVGIHVPECETTSIDVGEEVCKDVVCVDEALKFIETDTSIFSFDDNGDFRWAAVKDNEKCLLIRDAELFTFDDARDAFSTREKRPRDAFNLGARKLAGRLDIADLGFRLAGFCGDLETFETWESYDTAEDSEMEPYSIETCLHKIEFVIDDGRFKREIGRGKGKGGRGGNRKGQGRGGQGRGERGRGSRGQGGVKGNRRDGGKEGRGKGGRRSGGGIIQNALSNIPGLLP